MEVVRVTGTRMHQAQEALLGRKIMLQAGRVHGTML